MTSLKPSGAAIIEGDISLEEAIPKYVQQQQQQQQQQQLLASALKAEAEIFYSCSSRDLSFLNGSHEVVVVVVVVVVVMMMTTNGHHTPPPLTP